MRTVLYPLESGSSLIMSTEITCQHQSGTLLGISFPTFCVGKVFVSLHTSHPVMNLVMYLDTASGLPICLLGLWSRMKSNLERYRDHNAWQWFSLWASQK